MRGFANASYRSEIKMASGLPTPVLLIPFGPSIYRDACLRFFIRISYARLQSLSRNPWSGSLAYQPAVCQSRPILHSSGHVPPLLQCPLVRRRLRRNRCIGEIRM